MKERAFRNGCSLFCQIHVNFISVFCKLCLIDRRLLAPVYFIA